MKNQHLPKVILFQEDERAFNYMYKINYSLGSEIGVKSVDYDSFDFCKNHQIVGSRPEVGSLYLRHPYKENTYVNQDIAEETLFREKVQLYSSVASLLGARKISTKMIKSETNCNRYEVDINGRVKLVEVGINVAIQENRKYNELLEIREEFRLGKDFNLRKNLRQIRETIKKYNLNHEVGLIAIVDGRDNCSGVQLQRRSTKSEISLEYNNTLKVAAILNSPVFCLDGSFTRSINTVRKIILDIDIEF